MNMRYIWVSLILVLSMIMITSVQAAPHEDEEIQVEIKFDNVIENETTLFQGQAVIFNISVQNNNESSEDQDYKFTAETESSRIHLTPVLDTIQDVEHGFWVSFNLTIDTDDQIDPDDYEINVNLTSSANDTIFTEARITITVIPMPDFDVDISLSEFPEKMVVGDDHEITITLENKANVEDTLVLSVKYDQENITNAIIPFTQISHDIDDGDDKEITIKIHAEGPGTVKITFKVTSAGDPDVTETESISVTVTEKKTDSPKDDESFLESEVFGIPLIALFGIIIVVPVVAVVVITKKKKKKATAAAPVQQPGAMPGMAQPGYPGMPGQVAYGAPQPMVMHCPNCGGVIEVANPAMPQAVRCTHCGSGFNFPGTGGQAPPQAPAQPQYGAQPGYAAPQQPAGYQSTPCPACGTAIPVPPQRPVTISCPGCNSQYNLN